jgi:DNA-binding NarL/FixJ family response regulator
LNSVLVVDDHRLVRDALTTGIESQMPEVRVDAARDLESALEHLSRRPETDVILLDYRLPDTHSVSGIQGIRRVARHARIIVLSAYINNAMLTEIEAAGADGAMTKDVGLMELRTRLETAFNDNTRHFSAPEPRQVNEDLGRRYNLSRREFEAWSHLATGQRNAVIAARMGISESTVKVHLHNVFKKIGVHSRVEAYEFWRSHNGEATG